MTFSNKMYNILTLKLIYNRQKVVLLQKRWKQGSNHWSKVAKKKTSADRALEHFDDLYGNVYGKKWASIRLGLLSTSKYCAVINNYSDTDRIENNFQLSGALNLKSLLKVQRSRVKPRKKKVEDILNLERKMEILGKEKQEEEVSSVYPQESQGTWNHGPNENSSDRLIDPSLGIGTSSLYEFVPANKLKGREDWIGESKHYSYYDTPSDFPVEVENESYLNFPDSLKVYTFDMGNVSRFQKPQRGSTGVSDYYLMDGASLLPVLALDLQRGDRVLDVCAAPGGKTLLCHQTLLPEKVVSNDISQSRTKRIEKVLQEFMYNFEEKKVTKQIEIMQRDARQIDMFNYFNKILVDVPCTTDRHSVSEEENNIFKPSRIKERIKLPEVQADILAAALNLVEPGGTVVYATCTLSPVQNDGVVHMALRKIWEETNLKIVVKDLKQSLDDYRIVYRFDNSIGLRYGHLVLPYLPSNFGPMYFCKLVKCK